jgi:hypothetical protein
MIAHCMLINDRGETVSQQLPQECLKTLIRHARTLFVALEESYSIYMKGLSAAPLNSLGLSLLDSL